jgi:two-component system phosphate regulon sensor histidine kinase PhoR
LNLRRASRRGLLILGVLLRLALTATAGALPGLLFGRVWLGIALALGGALAFQWWRLATLVRWLRRNAADGAPEWSGHWGEAATLMLRQLRRKQFHKSRLLQLLRQLRQSTAALPDGVVLLDPKAEIVWFNRAAARLLSLSAASDHGLRIDNLVRYPEFGAYLRGGHYDAPVQVRSLSAAESWLSLQLVPFGEGQLLLMARDVTGQARLEAMRKDFVANASHELRSPLTVISGYLETLAGDEALDPALAGPLQEMRRQAQRMNGIVEDLLSLSRLEAADREAIRETIDVQAVLAQLKKDVLARPVHPQEVRVVSESPAQLLGDPMQIHSAFHNLVDNAAKYTPVGGGIHARWWVDLDGGHFAVRDTGIGIPAEHIPRLTERFYRVDAGRSRATGGSGLGLAIVKHVLQRHGATLEIRSTEGVGSEFICHFPAGRVIEVAKNSHGKGL